MSRGDDHERWLDMLARRVSDNVDLECTEQDDHDEPPCPKCERIRARIEALIVNRA